MCTNCIQNDITARAFIGSDGSCVQQCPYEGTNLYFVAEAETHKCILESQCSGKLIDEINYSGFAVKYCIQCPINMPFYDSAGACASSCPDTVDPSTMTCTTCPANQYRKRVVDPNSGVIYNQCVSSCPTN